MKGCFGCGKGAYIDQANFVSCNDWYCPISFHKYTPEEWQNKTWSDYKNMNNVSDNQV